MSGAGVTSDGGTGAGGVDGDGIASVAIVVTDSVSVEDNEEVKDPSKALAWSKEDVACLFVTNEGQEVSSLREEADTKKQDDDDNNDGAASRNMRASSSIDIDMTRALHGKRCLLCVISRSMRGRRTKWVIGTYYLSAHAAKPLAVDQ